MPERRDVVGLDIRSGVRGCGGKSDRSPSPPEPARTGRRTKNQRQRDETHGGASTMIACLLLGACLTAAGPDGSLGLAPKADPEGVTARGLPGLVRYRDEWAGAGRGRRARPGGRRSGRRPGRVPRPARPDARHARRRWSWPIGARIAGSSPRRSPT